MSNTLAAKEVRSRFKTVLSAASITVLIDAAPVAVEILNKPPLTPIKESRLPALYVFNSSEGNTPSGVGHEARDLAIEVMVMARDVDDPADQLDDAQLAVERAIIASGNLGGCCTSVRLTSAELATDQGRIVFGTRSLKYRCEFEITAADPTA